MKKSLTITILLLLCISTLVPMVSASETYTISPFSTKQISLTLNQGDTISGNIVVADGHTVTFYMEDPSGNTIVTYGAIASTPFSFTAPNTGVYNITITNGLLILSTTVTLDYSIQPGIAGFPFFIVIMAIVSVVVIAVVAVVGGYALHRHLKATESIGKPVGGSNRYCSGCGSPLSAGDGFCRKCGKKTT
jgi:hypothetical protein